MLQKGIETVCLDVRRGDARRARWLQQSAPRWKVTVKLESVEEFSRTLAKPRDRVTFQRTRLWYLAVLQLTFIIYIILYEHRCFRLLMRKTSVLKRYAGQAKVGDK